ADEQPGTANVADNRMRVAERLETSDQRGTDLTRVILQALLLHDVEDREANGARDGAAAERAEKLHPVVERFRDLARRHHRAQRVAVPDGLSEHGDVGNDALRFERIEVVAHPSVRRLYFIRDTDTPGGADDRVDRCEIPIRQDDLSADARRALRDECAGI